MPKDIVSFRPESRSLALILALAVMMSLPACGKRPAEPTRSTVATTPEQALVSALEMEAARGDAAAQVNLGVLYVRGDGVPRNLDMARLLFQNAEAQGSSTAKVNLGLMYINGEGVPRNVQRALELLWQAEALGDADAQVNLGLILIRGEILPRDLAAALELFQKSAARGNPLAQSNLGIMYLRGEGVARDLVLAHVWNSLAARQGVVQAALHRDQLVAQLTPAEHGESERITTSWKIGRLPARAK